MSGKSGARLDWPREGSEVLVAGEWVELRGRAAIASISPTSEEVVGHVPAATAEDVQTAVTRLRPLVEPWMSWPAVGRAALLRTFAEAIEEHADELIQLEIDDSGLTRRTANRDLGAAVSALMTFASHAIDVKGSSFPSEGSLAFTERVPYGIVARIVPFNHPLLFAAQAIASTVAAGNVVVVKPPEQCSLSALALGELTRSVFPPGVVNVLTGYGHEVGTGLVAHPEIPRIGFTGSVPTGRRILEAAAAHIKHVSLELGGKNPLVVTDGADTDLAADVAVKGMNFTHAGQSCQSTSRLLLHEDVFDEVVAKVSSRMTSLRVGDPNDERTDVGPLAFAGHYERVTGFIAAGIEEGASVAVGGGRPSGAERGFFLEPTLFVDVDPGMRIAREEIFGPVACAMRWSDDDEAIRLANDTPFGLNSRVVAGTVDRGLAIARQITAGTSLVNTDRGRARGMPFGGFKESGLGSEGGLQEVLSYTQEKSYVVGLR
jgi:acyl-CoA reductase-like NAD-dependent aldehyde dehydrogenase